MIRLPGARAARAWMRWTWSWNRDGRMPPIPELVLAERFVGEMQPARDVDLFHVAALFALEHRRRMEVSWEGFDVVHFAFDVASPGFDGDAEDWDRLLDALAVFFAWLQMRGEIALATRARLVTECAEQRETRRAVFPS